MTKMTGKNVKTEIPYRMCFGFQINLRDESGQVVATSCGFDSIVYDPSHEAWDGISFTRRAMNKLRKEALAMCSHYPAAITASYQTEQSGAINSAYRLVRISRLSRHDCRFHRIRF